MAGLFSVLSIARDGILTHGAALDVVSQNIAGVSTPGFVRRTADIQAVRSGGVTMKGATRSFDRFSFAQLADQQSRLSAAGTRADALSDVESLVAPSGGTISDRIDGLVDALHQLALQPSDVSMRSAMLARADAVARDFAETADSLSGLRGELFGQAKNVADEVNDRLSRLASMDKSIVEGDARGESTADLRDQRDEIVRDIAQRVGGHAVEDDHGSLTLFVAGTVLYQGGVAAKLSVAEDAQGALAIAADRNGNVVDVTSKVDGGVLGGIVEARDADIPRTLSMLDHLAFDFSNAVNAVHAGGTGLDGASGRPLFTSPTQIAGAAHAMALDPSMVDHPERVAASASSADLPGGNDVAISLSRIGEATLAGGGNVSERFAALANDVGVARTNAESERSMREDTVTTATALRESASGVSTDEEMIKLQQFQRGMEASMKVLSTVNDLFDSLMRI